MAARGYLDKTAYKTATFFSTNDNCYAILIVSKRRKLEWADIQHITTYWDWRFPACFRWLAETQNDCSPDACVDLYPVVRSMFCVLFGHDQGKYRDKSGIQQWWKHVRQVVIKLIAGAIWKGYLHEPYKPLFVILRGEMRL